MVSPHSFPAQEISGRKALLRVVQRGQGRQEEGRIKKLTRAGRKMVDLLMDFEGLKIQPQNMQK